MLVHRLGGGFGGKFLHSCAIAAASAVATEVTGSAIRSTDCRVKPFSRGSGGVGWGGRSAKAGMGIAIVIFKSISSALLFVWKAGEADSGPFIGHAIQRQALSNSRQAGCDAEGHLLGIVVDISVDAGHVATTMRFDLISMIDQGYFCPNWRVTMRQFKTNKVCAGPTRGPGQVPACLMIETVLEHLAHEANLCPILLRERNLFSEGQTNLNNVVLSHCPVKEVWSRLKKMANVQARLEDVNTFNKKNLWKKRGLSMTATRYDMCYYPTGFPTHVSIFAADGTVTVITAGVEMGQGLYTKVAQAVAHCLKIPLEFVKVRPNQNNVTPNPLWTGGSISSERCVANVNITHKLNVKELIHQKRKVSKIFRSQHYLVYISLKSIYRNETGAFRPKPTMSSSDASTSTSALLNAQTAILATFSSAKQNVRKLRSLEEDVSAFSDTKDVRAFSNPEQDVGTFSDTKDVRAFSNPEQDVGTFSGTKDTRAFSNPEQDVGTFSGT
ncbi:xanthine dehydrogenase/oxidase [Plakobranchus ocellatus]|uniref:Xanthine dehydrogenase/oxidase n=1 Tax=Plakobranchus ocellatus TaxID=259542 RepID=A0AAV4C7M6_9GAST|nr:xanthine dehydrogenase/oxidase [Plakobranchus ocellatus]